MDDRDEIEELRRQTEKGDRIQERTEESVSVDLASAIQDELDGQERKNVSVYYPRVAALLDVVEEDPEEREQLAAALGIDESEEADRSDILRAAIREGIRSADPELWESVREGVGRHAADGL